MERRFAQCAGPGVRGCEVWGHLHAGPDQLRMQEAWRFSLRARGGFPPHGGQWVAADGSTVTYFVTVAPTPIFITHVVLLPADQQTYAPAPPDPAPDAVVADAGGSWGDTQPTDQNSDPPPALADIPQQVKDQAANGMLCRRQRIDVMDDDASDEANGPMICRGADGNEYLAQDDASAQSGSTG
jgi:hypothetical protein